MFFTQETSDVTVGSILTSLTYRMGSKVCGTLVPRKVLWDLGWQLGGTIGKWLLCKKKWQNLGYLTLAWSPTDYLQCPSPLGTWWAGSLVFSTRAHPATEGVHKGFFSSPKETHHHRTTASVRIESVVRDARACKLPVEPTEARWQLGEQHWFTPTWSPELRVISELVSENETWSTDCQ